MAAPGRRDGSSAGGDGQELLVTAQEAGREGAEAMLAGAEHGGAELGKDLFGQIGVGQQPGRAAEAGKEAEAPCERHASHAEQAPSAAIGAADPAFQAAEDGDAGPAVIGQGLEELGPEALPGPAAELAGDGVGLAEGGRQGGPGGRGAAGEGVGGEPEDGVEP